MIGVGQPLLVLPPRALGEGTVLTFAGMVCYYAKVFTVSVHWHVDTPHG